MQVQFQIEYRTYFGQQVMISGSHNALGKGDRNKAVTMQITDPLAGIWTLTIDVVPGETFSYRYFIKEGQNTKFIDEWGPDRIFHEPSLKCQAKLCIDFWRSMSDPDFALFSSAFSGAIFNTQNHKYQRKQPKFSKNQPITLRFRPSAIRLKSEHKLAVAGNVRTLGTWHDDQAIDLDNQDFPFWHGEVNVSPSDFPVYYKYLVKNEDDNTEFWEKSEERVLYLPQGFVPEIIEINNEKFDYPRYPWKGAGVAIPVFSLRRENGSGVGEFSDIKLLVDWASMVGLKMIQILPVNDTVATHSWHDSYPYAAISVYALHPIYINLTLIGTLKSDITAKVIEAQSLFLNSLHQIDYEAVMALKSRFFKLIYDLQKLDLWHDPEFVSFFETNQFWLEPYAAFSYLRDLFNTADFKRWGEFSQPDKEIIRLITAHDSPHFDDIAIHYFIQFHAHKQLLDASEYARSKGIALKGDIPIGIYRNSVDAWTNPELFNLNCQAGAPPDDFSSNGQNWRFPTYNWGKMALDNYGWWQQRLKQMAKYFDAFRIDHILGFFRIWEIPESQVEGLMGYFNPSIPYTSSELNDRGLYFDESRMCDPYIRDYFLEERFGQLKEYVKQNFLTEYSPGQFTLKPEFDTQRKIEDYFSPGPDTSADEISKMLYIKRGLFSLVSEVVFIRAPHDQEGYFPRNGLHATKSYQDLDQRFRQIIDNIYIEYFYRRNENFWSEKAMTKLPVIKNSTDMLLCGEDLGMVPACVPHVMNNLGILSLEIQRMPKNPDFKFGKTESYPYLSVATPSSHDTSTIRAWWEENRDLTQEFFNQILGNSGTAPEKCEPWIVEQIITQHLFSPSMWSIFPIQDLFGINSDLRVANPHTERINLPSNPNHYWRYRMHISLESLLIQDALNQRIRDLIETSGRLDIY